MNVQDTADTSDACQTTGNTGPVIGERRAIVAAAVLLALAWGAGMLSFEWVAEIEKIDDLRAEQVTLLHAGLLTAFWIVGTALVAIYSRPAAKLPGRDRSNGSRPARRFTMAAGGFALATLVSAAALLGIASTAAIVVTPPIAWILVSTFSAFGAIIGYRFGR